MSCTPEQLLGPAKAVCAVAQDEAMYRAVANRAYYASYHCCRLYHASLPHMGTASAKGVHEELISRLQSPSAKLTKNGRARSVAIGKYLREVCAHRVKADYFIEVDFEPAWMEASISTASSIFAGTKWPKARCDPGFFAHHHHSIKPQLYRELAPFCRERCSAVRFLS